MSDEAPGTPPPATPSVLARTLLWIGIAGASAAATYFIVRATMRVNAPAPDETAERIQALIDEANRLLHNLNESRHA